MILALITTLSFAAAGAEPVAAISLYNPTEWQGSFLVEIPTGKIAAPNLLDWQRVHLLTPKGDIPFALREGRAHWQTHFTSPVEHPRAEDLLVFACEVPPAEWMKIEVHEDPALASDKTNSLTQENALCTIQYPNIKTTIDTSTGQLLQLTNNNEPLLSSPFSINVNKLAESNAYELVGGFGPGYADPVDPNAPHIKINYAEPISCHVKLVSSSSSAAMTEVNFLIDVEKGPSIALTYRVYANGVIDMIADGLPWQGESPWCHHAARYSLPLSGTKESIPCLEDRFAFYGFKGYTAAVKQAANVWRGEHITTIELGEESVNGRRWARRLFPCPSGDAKVIQNRIEAMDEGLIVDILPMHDPVQTDSPVFQSNLMPNAESLGIDGDGFQIRPLGNGKDWRIIAGTQNGLYRAKNCIAAYQARHGASVPLVAENPVVNLRAGGFGGGDFEVDFPYGTEEEWKSVLENLAGSGMNYFTCLGMWGNWKMPVTYKYMPELRSSAPDAYDESSGAKFSEVDQHRERALRLTQFLHERGGKVWLWIPIGCVPTTFVHAFPDVMAPVPDKGHSDKIPCFTHPDYHRYLDIYFKELLETYPIDGLMLVRDDNGGLCTCKRCQEFVAASRTKNAAWEQYLAIYDLLHRKGFKGDIAVYPYFDGYAPQLEPLIPKDVYVVGHGGELAVLTRDYSRIGLMGDTWLDNLYANFRIPPSPRMHRLLADRGSFWIGGTYCGTELPWESVGRFGWEPSATPNTFRYEWGLKTFGQDSAMDFVRMNQIYEHLWGINARYMPPATWMKLDPSERAPVLEDAMANVAALRERLTILKQKTDAKSHARWFAHMELFAPFFEYHLHRLDLFATIYDMVIAHQDALVKGERLTEDVRQKILALYKEIYDWAAKYDAQMKTGPNGMLERCRWMTSPYKEWMAGYDQWLEGFLKVKQFAGTMQLKTTDIKADQPFTLTVELHNTGVCPWLPGVGQQLQLSGVAEQLGLPTSWPYDGEWTAPGDTRTIQLQGTTPTTPASGILKAGFTSPFRVPEEFIKAEINVEWK
ncbi:MAG TPA: hypothetical protein PLI09_22535 [Candidatus Hydrogenedentes bacterium]|nr:hypothetical protein [Candidatus Hydrogenedentota bacterium]